MSKQLFAAFCMQIATLAFAADSAAAGTKPLQDREIEAVCAMGADLDWTFYAIPIGEDLTKSRELGAQINDADFIPLPPSIKCQGKRKGLRPKRPTFGIRFDSFWLSEDGSRAAISGGWIVSELTGGGATCYYSRMDSQWKRQGCVGTWAI